MKAFFTKIRVLLIFAILLACGGWADAQKAKPKATPKATPPAKITKAEQKPILSTVEAEIFSEINSLRANPAAYIKYLEQMKPNFNGTALMLPDGTRMITSEGVGGVADAIATLKSTRPLPAFKLSPGLSKAAAAHLDDMMKSNSTGHKGSDGSWPPNRVDRYGFWSVEVKENISYRAQTVRDIVMNMLIDDGNPKRDHRKNLLSSNLKVAGLSFGESKSYGKLCVIVFTVAFVDKKSGK